MLVKPVTSKAHLTFYSSLSLVGCSCSCKRGFQKYFYIVNFHQPIPFYYYGMNPLSNEEVKMKGDLYVW